MSGAPGRDGPEVNTFAQILLASGFPATQWQNRRTLQPHRESAMAITVPIDLGHELEVNAPCAEVFGVLSDVPGPGVGFGGEV
jgi:hypothetical protein